MCRKNQRASHAVSRRRVLFPAIHVGAGQGRVLQEASSLRAGGHCSEHRVLPGLWADSVFALTVTHTPKHTHWTQEGEKERGRKENREEERGKEGRQEKEKGGRRERGRKGERQRKTGDRIIQKQSILRLCEKQPFVEVIATAQTEIIFSWINHCPGWRRRTWTICTELLGK